MRIIFHLGTYKTGSTSFQNSLFKNRDFLMKNGILYPITGMAKDSNLGYRHTPLIHQYITGKQDVCPENFMKELDESNAETVIISSEAWSNPSYLSHLTQFVSILQENGHRDCSGLLVLRNLERNQVSNYREFTVNQNNSASYQRYIRNHHGMFDYLLLARTYRSIFGSRFVALPFDGSQDITESLLSAMGMGDLYSRMERVERGNVKSVSALEVEAMRCANFLKKPKNEGVSALLSIISEDSKLGDDVWTERYSGDVPIFTYAYRRSLRNTLDWSESETEAIFNQSAPEGRNVEELTNRLIDRQKSS